MTNREQLLDELRPVAFAIAYRMLGSVSEAEDVGHEALLRVHQTLHAGKQIAWPREFAITATTRPPINEVRSPLRVRVRHERHVSEVAVRAHHHRRLGVSGPALRQPTRCRWRCWYCWTASRLSSEPCCCFTMC